jgi:hypothetical protein
MDRLEALAVAWREQAARYEADGQPGAALLRRVAGELEATVRAQRVETLTLQQAAEETGLSYDTVQRRVATGRLPNVGRRGAPRVRRCDLPGTPAGPDLAGAVLAEYRTGGGG